jgi:hypothetical protein
MSKRKKLLLFVKFLYWKKETNKVSDMKQVTDSEFHIAPYFIIFGDYLGH